MSEHALWEWLRGILPRGHYSRIESPETAAGFPDVHYTVHPGYRSGTIELKFSRHPNSFTPFKRDGLRESQIRWINEEVAAGGLVWIVGQVKEQVFWVRGQGCPLFNGMNLDQFGEWSSLILPRKKPRPKHLRRIQELLNGGSTK